MKIYLGKSNKADKTIVGKLRMTLIKTGHDVYEWDNEEGSNKIFTSDLYLFVPDSKLEPSQITIIIGKGLFTEIKNAMHVYCLYYVDKEDFVFCKTSIPRIKDEKNFVEYAEVELIGDDFTLEQLTTQ